MTSDRSARVAIVQNSVEGLGSLAAPLSKDARLTFCRADRGVSLPSPDEFDALVVLGGPASAYDTTRTVRAELDMIRKTLDAGKPYFGVCLGAQLLAKACGADVYPAASGEFGIGTVRPTVNAAGDLLFGSVAGRETVSVFQWHGDTFDLPDGAVRLAEGVVCPNQALRVGRAWGVQFHVETDAASLYDWLYGDERAVYDGDVERRALCRDDLLSSLKSVELEQRELAVSMASAFRALVDG